MHATIRKKKKVDAPLLFLLFQRVLHPVSARRATEKDCRYSEHFEDVVDAGKQATLVNLVGTDASAVCQL